MLVLEIEKPRRGWWIKGLKRQIWIVTPFILFTCLMLNLEGKSASFIMLYELKLISVMLFYCLVLSHYYEYPYCVKVNKDGVEIGYIHMGINLKRKYSYKRIEIISEFYRDKRYTVFRDKVFVNFSLTLDESYGWSKEKQEALIEFVKSKDIKVNSLT